MPSTGCEKTSRMKGLNLESVGRTFLGDCLAPLHQADAQAEVLLRRAQTVVWLPQNSEFRFKRVILQRRIVRLTHVLLRKLYRRVASESVGPADDGGGDVRRGNFGRTSGEAGRIDFGGAALWIVPPTSCRLIRPRTTRCCLKAESYDSADRYAACSSWQWKGEATAMLALLCAIRTRLRAGDPTSQKNGPHLPSALHTNDTHNLRVCTSVERPLRP